jgi:dCTP diphosphatase
LRKSCHIAIGSRVGEGVVGCYARPVTAPPSHGLTQLRDALRQFAAERDWDQFHSPKNLASALAVEAAELLERFQWLTEDESRNLPPPELEKVRQEMADVLNYLVRLADKLDVNLIEAARAKIEINARKYPADLARGKAKKYSEL